MGTLGLENFIKEAKVITTFECIALMIALSFNTSS